MVNPGQQMAQIYTYDDNRNLLSIRAINTPWFKRDFEYDALNRLQSATSINNGTIDYTYDNVGNRLSRSINGQIDEYSYVSGTNRIDQINGPNPAGFSYDASGNITGIDLKTFVYNQNNRLVRVEEGAAILGEYTYNGLGQRVIKDAAGVETIFLYDFDGNIVAQSASDGTIKIEYLYAEQARMAMVDVGAGQTYFFANNYLGTPLLVTDSSGNVV
ncbi:MAG: hypothetical protein KJP06_05825, partial [Deltaproteobacteria bacterium]|nr:hypothetical protein [Deltaproteobacteria bacterium]